MLLLYGIVFYLFVGLHNLASACSSKSNADDSKIKNLGNSLWNFQTDFVQHAGKHDKSSIVYSPHSAAISLLAVAFGGDIRYKLAEALHLNSTDLKLPIRGSGTFSTELKEYVRLGGVGSPSAPILKRKYTNYVSKKCKVSSHYADVLEVLSVNSLIPKGGMSSKHTVQSVVVDESKIIISNFADNCRIKKSENRLDFHAENVREGNIKSLDGAKFYSLRPTSSDFSSDDKVRLIFIIPPKGKKVKHFKQKFSNLKYHELFEGKKKSLTFSMAKPRKISKSYDFKTYLAHVNIKMSHKSAGVITDKFTDVCKNVDNSKMHGFHIKQSAKLEFDGNDLKKAPQCSNAKRRINVKLPQSLMILVIAKKTILIAATT